MFLGQVRPVPKGRGPSASLQIFGTPLNRSKWFDLERRNVVVVF